MKNEVIALSEYHNIISTLIEKHRFNSLLKIEVTSFMIKYYKDSNLLKKSAKNHFKDFFSSLLTVLYTKSQDLNVINECIYILEKEGFIKVKTDNVVRIKNLFYVSDDFFSNTEVDETIRIINEMSIDSFVEDLITYA